MAPSFRSRLVSILAWTALTTGCGSDRSEPRTPSSTNAEARAETSTRIEPEPSEPADVREFRLDIADRQKLVERTEAPSVARALVTAAEEFYQTHRSMLHRSFQDSVAELEDASPPDPTSARLVSSIDASTSEDEAERSKLARFHLVFSPDVRKQAENAFNAAFVPLASVQLEMPVSRAGELYGFFSVVEPSYVRCGQTAVCIRYGESDTFIVSFFEVEEGLWTPLAVAWWTTVPESSPEEGIGQDPPRPNGPTGEAPVRSPGMP